MKSQINILALTPMRNEQEMIPGYLKNIFLIADAAIILDDGSTDNTQGVLRHNKILKYIHKKHINWNDLENRQILLNEGYKHNPQWLLWIDADERFIKSDIESFKIQLSQTCADIISFPLYHCWDSAIYYRSDYPLSKSGIQIKRRMFRNIGRYLLNTKNTLHFDLIPIAGGEWLSSQRIKHLGNISKTNRHKRYERYVSLDPDNKYNAVGYHHLIDQCVVKKRFK